MVCSSQFLQPWLEFTSVVLRALRLLTRLASIATLLLLTILLLVLWRTRQAPRRQHQD